MGSDVITTDLKMEAQIVAVLLVVILSLGAYADGSTTTISIENSSPTIDSVTTYNNYTNRSVNSPTSSFSTYNDTRNVSIQLVVSDLNGYYDIEAAKVRIVLWNGTDETEFSGFGSDYLNATLEYSTLTQSIYTYSHNMSATDPSRLGTESPPLYYRVKAQVEDAHTAVTSDTSSAENADFTYQGQLPSFGIEISIADTTLEPGDDVDAAVNITKHAPSDPKNVNLTFELLNPLGNVADSENESVTVNATVNRTLSLTIPASGSDGTYTFRVTVSYPEGTTTGQQAIAVSSPEEEEDEEGEEEGGGELKGFAISPQTVREQFSRVSFLSIPKAISVFPGEERLLSVVVQGADNPAPGVSLEVEGVFPPASITPTVVPVIYPDSDELFIVRLKTPKQLAPGRYKFNIIAKLKDVEILRDSFYLEVSEPSGEPTIARLETLSHEIENMFDVLHDMRAELLKKQASGVDTDALLDRIDAAKEYLELATSEFNNQDYESSRKYLGRSREIILESAERAGELSKPVGYSVDLNLVIVFLSAVAVVLLFLVLRRRPSRRFKRILERQELEALSRAVSRK